MLSAEGAIDAAAIAQIIGLNLVLSGDNARVMALVTRGLPAAQRRIVRVQIDAIGGAAVLRGHHQRGAHLEQLLAPVAARRGGLLG